MLKSSALGLGLLLTFGCASSPTSTDNESGTRQIHRNAVLYEGSEMVAAIGFSTSKGTFGEPWLVLSAEIMATRGSGPAFVRRSDITARTPDGRRLTLITQEEFLANGPRLKIPLNRVLSHLPLLYRYQTSDVPCDEWFLTDPRRSIALDQVPLNSFQACSGPLVFRVPGGVQPGRWRIVFELEESQPDIPFVLELEN